MDQTRAFVDTESIRYFRDQASLGSPTISPGDLRSVAGPVTSVLDVGCGTGDNLRSVVSLLHARQGTGVEPGAETVEALNGRYRNDPQLRFEVASAHRLPFEADSFDVVLCWSVLHWLGRNEYLQALGELIRVTRSWLIIMDFVGAEDYRVPYHHREGLFTYKSDFRVPLLASGVMELVSEARWWAPDGRSRQTLTPGDLMPFIERTENYHARLACTFLKNPERLMVLTEDSFGGGS